MSFLDKVILGYIGFSLYAPLLWFGCCVMQAVDVHGWTDFTIWQKAIAVVLILIPLAIIVRYFRAEYEREQQ